MSKLSKKTLDGNVETLLLTILSEGPSYGYQIVQDLNTKAPGLLNLQQGTVYPVLHRLEERELIKPDWRKAENGRKRKYYMLTPKGKGALEENRNQWAVLSKVMNRFIGSPETGRRNPQPA